MITPEDTRKYLTVVGKRGLTTLSTIEKLRPFVEMMQSEMGAEFLRDDVQQHSELINKIYEGLIDKGEAAQRDVIALQLLHKRLQKIYDRLSIYKDSVNKVKGGSQNE
jgi:arginine decarboxylase-like protein